MNKEKYHEIVQSILLHNDINHFDDNDNLLSEYPDLKYLYVRYRLRKDELEAELKANLRKFEKGNVK